MDTPPIPRDEARRLAALYATSLLGSRPDEAFDRITRLAARALDMPMAVVSLVDKDIQWFKSRCGVEMGKTPRDVSFCGHAILSDAPMVVADTARDRRFADNPLVLGEPHIRFYAGVQLYSLDRMKLGTLCVMDRRPRQLSDADLASLRDCAHMVEQQIYHHQLAAAAQALAEQLADGSGAARPPAASQVEFLLNHDVLTGLANRHALVRAIQAGAAGWRERGARPIVVSVNLDRFKRLNEVLGYQLGDETLVAITRSLQDHLEGGDILARAGSDEFILLLHEPGDDARVRSTLEGLLRAVNRQIIAGGNEVALTCSIGYARFPTDGDDADALLSNATAAMRHAKSLGGAAVEAYSDGLRTELGRRLTLESHLRRATEHGELFLQYQPKVRLATGQVAGFEALVRWQHPEYGLIAPEEFIPIAEETGQIVAIGTWVLRAAATQLAAWREDGVPAVPVAVNLSARQFLQSDVVALVEEMVRDTGIEPGLLELELTESVSMADPARSVAVMHRLRAIGVTLSIDDFGTGYSSFAYLRRLPIDKLKIDRSFIQDMVQSVESLAIVQAMVAMAHRLHLEVVAEGADTAEQIAALRRAECDQVQGYFYSMPLRAADCGPYLRSLEAAESAA